MLFFIHKTTGKTISQDTYNELDIREKVDYDIKSTAREAAYNTTPPSRIEHHYHSSPPPKSDSGDALLSGVIGYATDNALLGGLLGGSLLGGLAGDLFNDGDIF